MYFHGEGFDADTEMERIKTVNTTNQFSWKDSFYALKDSQVRNPILLISTLSVFKELGGHVAMISFSAHILENQQGVDPNVASLFYPLFLTIGVISSLFILDRCKLKWLLIFASSLQAISHFSMSLYYLVSQNFLHCDSHSTRLCRTLSFWPVSNVALYSFSYTFGFLSVIYALKVIMITSHRELSLAILEVVTSFTGCVVAYAFYFILDSVGGLWNFLLFGLVHVVSLPIIYVFLKI